MLHGQLVRVLYNLRAIHKPRDHLKGVTPLVRLPTLHVKKIFCMKKSTQRGSGRSKKNYTWFMGGPLGYT